MEIKEKLAGIWLKIRANIDRSAFILFLVILVIVLGTYGYEISSPGPEYISSTGSQIQQLLPNDSYNKVIGYMQSNPDLNKDEELRKIRDFSMFDYKYVRDRDELQKEADKKFERAAKLYKENKIDEAEKILKEILLTWPTHIASKELLDKIAKSKVTPTPTPTPKPAMPGPGGPMPGEPVPGI